MGTLSRVYGDTFSGCPLQDIILCPSCPQTFYCIHHGLPSSVWTEEPAPEVDEEEDNTYLCQVCGKRDTSECSTCDIYLCPGCMHERIFEIDVPE